MFEGRPNVLEGSFGFHMSSFLSLVNSAYLTYIGSEIEVDGEKTDNSEIRFNFSVSFQKFHSSLVKKYSDAIVELEEMLNETYNKYNKLYFITRLIAEVESYRWLLEKDHNGIYKHKLFQFSNTSQELKYQDRKVNESYCQEYYQWMNYYLEKMSIFLLNLKEITERTNHLEFPIPKLMIPDANASTKERPLEYFDYLFTRNGLYYLRMQFIPTDEDYYYGDLKYDPKTETITEYFQDPETGEWSESKKEFKRLFLERITKEFLLSRKFIDEHIYDLQDELSITFFIKLIIIRLKFLITAINRYPDAKRYEDSPRPINGLIRFIYEKYLDFIPKDLLPLPDKSIVIEGPIGKVEKSAPKSVLVTFKWKSKPSGMSTMLWKLLKDAGFIHNNTDLDVFHNGFSGLSFAHPLKIRWTVLARNNQVNKHMLFYLMNMLAENKLIEENTNNREFIMTLGYVFCGPNGEPLRNLEVSNSTSAKMLKNQTSDKQKIDEIVKALLIYEARAK